MTIPKPGDSEDYKTSSNNFKQLNSGELRRKMKKKNEHYSNQPTFYDCSPFLSIAQDLLLSLKENLIEELTIVTAYLKGNLPNFDIFIDDQAVTIEETNKLLPNERHYIVPAYKCTDYLQAPNIYHLKTTVSDLKKEDFVQAAAEY
ncbi:hypothetical protein BC937DRAFT_95552 [Endogone sp. FLAS-F59071]|nr:hypothetical protein BC937DRAFT_95552 [Endogone sp. FLAS-F59071]|eukprot:RUS22880.1 hypothetical protein BC937DRAFT_95552 [Endogone sp. FLAS-F59071]